MSHDQRIQEDPFVLRIPCELYICIAGTLSRIKNANVRDVCFPCLGHALPLIIVCLNLYSRFTDWQKKTATSKRRDNIKQQTKF